MTYQACWYKAFSVSLVVHVVLALMLALLVRNIEIPQMPETYITLEFVDSAAGQTIDSSADDEAASQPEPRRDHIKPHVERTVPTTAVRPEPRRDHVNPKPHTASAVSSPVGLEPPAAGGGAVPVQPESTGGGATAQTSSAQGAPAGKASGARQGGADIDGIIRAFLARVERNKTYPYMARQRGQTGTVTVAVRLTADGDLAEARVIKSSGVAVLDQEALKLVRRVCPFRHKAGRPLAMNIPIVYNLN